MRSPSFALFFFFVCMVVGGASAHCFTLADTECEWCTDLEGTYIACPQPAEPFYGQDAQYTGAALSLRDNGDGTVSDLNTGLVWQQTMDTAYKTYEDASGYCQLLSLAGRTWRVPSMWELITIAPYGYGPTIYTFFPNMADALAGGHQSMWSSTVDNFSSYPLYKAYNVMKRYGVSGSYDGREELVAICVSGDSISHDNYTDNSDGTISHAGTGLMWEKASSTDSMNWEAALAYCEAQTTGGHSDWRLPNTREMQYILYYDAEASPTLPGVFEGVTANYWSSTVTLRGCSTYPPEVGDLGGTYIMTVRTARATASEVPNANDIQSGHVMCVRTIGGNSSSSKGQAARNMLLLK